MSWGAVTCSTPGAGCCHNVQLYSELHATTETGGPMPGCVKWAGGEHRTLTWHSRTLLSLGKIILVNHGQDVRHVLPGGE